MIFRKRLPPHFLSCTSAHPYVLKYIYNFSVSPVGVLLLSQNYSTSWLIAYFFPLKAFDFKGIQNSFLK